MNGLSLTITENPRAKWVRLKLVPGKGLEVVVPRGFNQKKLPAILQEKGQWIAKQRQRMESQGIQFTEEVIPLPQELTLQAIERQWEIHYLPQAKPLRILKNAHRLIVRGEQSKKTEVFRALAQFVGQQAREVLPPLLRRVSEQTGLNYEGVHIRTQKSRWGSCSAKKNINLNCKLLFLPPPLVKHLMLHELCHTVHMNHSSQYWELVAAHEPEYKRLEQSLSHGLGFVPAWMP